MIEMPLFSVEIMVNGKIYLDVETDSKHDAEYIAMNRIEKMLENHSKINNFTFSVIDACEYDDDGEQVYTGIEEI